MNRIDMVRALVRPFCVVWSVVMISVLAFRGMQGEPAMPVDGVAADCVYTLIGIASAVTIEWTGERGIRHILSLWKTIRKP